MTMIEKTLRFIALGCVFAVPFTVLYVAGSLFFPFITGKGFAFRILVEIAASAWLGLALLNPAYRPKRNWILLAFTAFITLIALSDAFGVYPLKSFWSNFERMEGWVTLAHLFAYFVVAGSLLTKNLWRGWWQTSLGASVLVAGYALLQLAGFFAINQSGSRLDATLGNSTYLGIYMLFHVFIAAMLLVRAWKEQPQSRTAYAWLYGSIIVLDTFVLFFTATRGAILGLLGGAFLALVIFAFSSLNRSVARRAGAAVACALVLGGGFWAMRGAFAESRIEPVRRLATMSFTETTIISRFMNWGMAWQGVKERPILGWGQENYAAVFDKYYDPKMYAQEPWFDRVHDIIFDWLVAGGFLGLIAYLSLWLAALLLLWRSGAFEAYERAIITGLLAGYFFYNLFTFDNITSYILFVSLLAYIAVRTSREKKPLIPERYALHKAAAPIVGASAVVLAGALVIGVNAEAISTNKAIIQGLSRHDSPEKNYAYFERAVRARTVGAQEAREQLMQVAGMAATQEGIPQELKIRFADLAVRELGKQAEDASYAARAPFFLGILLDSYGAHEQAAAALAEAHRRSPEKQSILFQLGQNAFVRGKHDEGLGYFKTAFELAPAYENAQLMYATAGVLAGKQEAVINDFEDAKRADPSLAHALDAVIAKMRSGALKQ